MKVKVDLDRDLIEKCKQTGGNVNAIINNALKSYFDVIDSHNSLLGRRPSRSSKISSDNYKGLTQSEIKPEFEKKESKPKIALLDDYDITDDDIPF